MERIQFLTQAETHELFKAIVNDNSKYALRNQAIFAIALYCALRASEIGLIKVFDYHKSQKRIYCKRLKNGNPNTLMIVDTYIFNVLNTYWEWRIRQTEITSDYLFLSQKHLPISRKMLDYLMKKYCRDTSIPISKHHFHVLRHTRAMELIETPGVELRDVQWWLGHKNISNTMIYLNYTTKYQNYLYELLKKRNEYVQRLEESK